MDKLNNKKGISLIVLVITIIVMIILAAAIILSLQSSGIIGKANKAKTDSDASNVKELAALATSEWELMTTEEKSGTTYEEYMKNKMEPLLGDKTDEWVVMNVKLRNLTDMGYIVSSVDGTVYLTGLDSDAKKSVSTVISKGYTVKDLNSEVVTDGKMSTEYKIYKGEEELATVVYFGEVDGSITSVTMSDAARISNAIMGYMEIKPYMDLNHDGILSLGDANVITGYYMGNFDINEQQNVGVNKITKVIEKSKTISKEEMFEILAIHSGEITYNETEKAYYLTLKKPYTYKELHDEIKSKYQCSVEYWDDSIIDNIDNQSTEIIKSGIYVSIGIICYEKIDGDTSYNFASDLEFTTK